MKKLLSLLLALALLLPAAALADPDLTAMTDQELKDLIAACSAELRARSTTDPEGTLLFQYEQVRVYQTGDAYISGDYLYVPVAVYNDMEHEMVMSAESAICNGWDIYAGNCRASGHAKKKNEIYFKVGDADITTIDQIVSLAFRWEVYDYDATEKVFKQEESAEYRFW